MSRRKKYKLLLINPVNRRRKGLKRDSVVFHPPMALGIIAALTPGHWDVEILDENFQEFEYKEADLVGFTALTATVNRCYELSSLFRRKNTHTVIGGIHVSMLPEEAAGYFDTVVIGEAESVWGEVISNFETGTIKKQYKGELLPLVQSPIPRFDLYNPEYLLGSIQTTRGCPMKCDFCSVHVFNGMHYRYRPIEEVLDEMEAIPQPRIYIVDDNLVGYSKKSRARAIELFKGMIKRGIKEDWDCAASMNIAEDEEVLKYAAESGCKMIFLGIESEVVEQLEQVNKKVNLKIGVDKFKEVYAKIKKHGIAVIGAFIFGLDSDTPETLHHRVDYMLNADIDVMQATVLTPLPGTQLYDRLKKEERLVFTNYPDDWERYNYAEVVYKPNLMTTEELANEVKKCWGRIYNEIVMKKKFLNTLKTTRDPTSATWAYASNLICHNLVFEMEKKHLDLENTFPQLLKKLDIND